MRQQGFTLLEVMVALAILAVALVTILSLQAASIDLGNEATVITKATLLAQERMTGLISQERLRPGQDEGELKENIPPFGWKTTVEDTDREGMQKVTLVVTWQEGSKTRDLELVTYVASQR